MGKLIAVVGPTASGKTELALEIARRYKGEIICTDSRTLYKGMDIGTAKPTPTEQAEVPHHMLDIIEPDQAYSAAEFQKQANRLIDEIEQRGHLPILVGGTGLYADAVLYNYEFPPQADPKLRAELEKLSPDQLVQRLRAIDPDTEEQVDTKNRRRVIRAIETAGHRPSKSRLRAGALVLGIAPTPAEHERKIVMRDEQWLKDGLIEEVRGLIDRYGDVQPLNTVPYREIARYLSGGCSLDEALEQIHVKIRQLAKRQLTWFKRNPDIHWIADTGSDLKLAQDWLNSKL